MPKVNYIVVILGTELNFFICGLQNLKVSGDEIIAYLILSI